MTANTPPTLELNLQDAFYCDSPQKGELDSVIPSHTWESWFQTWLTALETNLPSAVSYEITLRLTGDSEIQSLNAEYRHQDQTTDVLSFAALEVESPTPSPWLSSEPLYLGDIVISVETAARQAIEQHQTLTGELAWLACHGLLHLLGWDHPDEDSLTAMLTQQETLLALVGLQPQRVLSTF